MNSVTVSPGRAYPLGATVEADGVNFSVFTKRGTQVELLLFDHYADPEPARVVRLDPLIHKTFYYWHVKVHGIDQGQVYGYRVEGPSRPHTGDRFNPAKVLFDPYARCAVYGDNWSRQDALGMEPNIASSIKAKVVGNGGYEWEEDQPLGHPFSDLVIYEMHVRGFTRHSSSQVADPGTFTGVIEKIPYLVSLGVNAVELLPVQQYDPQSVPAGNPDTGEPLVNYWGYDPIAFFAPHHGYRKPNEDHCVVNEFRDMVKALHQAGIEVILDVVFNHTAEGDETGPTISFRGFENRAYYLLADNPAEYRDYSGTGNTFKCNHAVVRRLIMDSLRYWVQEMHVDGFRFDLAAILSRDEYGKPMKNPPILWSIESDPVLAKTKIIAEAWDAAGLYQVGSFIGDRWAEWNGRYRDDVRRFVKGDEGMVPDLASRLMGSPDLYRDPGRQPHRSINFITCHDGFTLNDLVSYDKKHNLANGEENQDGHDANYSWNCGVEGRTDDQHIERVRIKQIKNFIAILFLSQGTPMLQMGDEMRRTQGGNNNAYCQDNEISWLDWELWERNNEIFRFVQEMIRFRRDHPCLNAEVFVSERKLPDGSGKHVTWHGIRLNEPDWNSNSRSIAFHMHDFPNECDLYIMINSFWEDLSFAVPDLPDGVCWVRAIDTARTTPNDLITNIQESTSVAHEYKVEARSVVVLRSANAV